MNFERDFSSQGSCRVVQCQMSERSLAHRQRDIYETHKHRAYAVALFFALVFNLRRSVEQAAMPIAMAMAWRGLISCIIVRGLHQARSV